MIRPEYCGKIYIEPLSLKDKVKGFIDDAIHYIRLWLLISLAASSPIWVHYIIYEVF